MSDATRNRKIKHFVSSDIKGDVRAIFYKEKTGWEHEKRAAGRNKMASGRRNFMEQQAGRE